MTLFKSPELNSLTESYVESEGITSTTSKIYLIKLSHIFVPEYTGNYLMDVYSEIAQSLVAQRTYIKFSINNSILIEVSPPFKENYTNDQWLSIMGFKRLELTKPMSYTFNIEFKATGGTAHIRRARILIRRSF
jgi:hypothetical protein